MQTLRTSDQIAEVGGGGRAVGRIGGGSGWKGGGGGGVGFAPDSKSELHPQWQPAEAPQRLGAGPASCRCRWRCQRALAIGGQGPPADPPAAPALPAALSPSPPHPRHLQTCHKSCPQPGRLSTGIFLSRAINLAKNRFAHQKWSQQQPAVSQENSMLSTGAQALLQQHRHSQRTLALASNDRARHVTGISQELE